MNGIVVSAEIAMQYNGTRNGVNVVMFTELNDGTFFAPANMLEIIPEAFPIYTLREVYDHEIKISEKTRRQKVDEITEYLKRTLNTKSFTYFLNDTEGLLWNYILGSEALIYWVTSSDGGYWGDYSSDGYISKGYSSPEDFEVVKRILIDQQ
jgi:hypothetical protein